MAHAPVGIPRHRLRMHITTRRGRGGGASVCTHSSKKTQTITTLLGTPIQPFVRICRRKHDIRQTTQTRCELLHCAEFCTTLRDETKNNKMNDPNMLCTFDTMSRNSATHPFHPVLLQGEALGFSSQVVDLPRQDNVLPVQPGPVLVEHPHILQTHSFSFQQSRVMPDVIEHK